MSKSNVMPKRGSVFQAVKGLHPSYSVFDLSYVKTMTLDMGQLIPVACEEVVPGDIFKIGNQMVLRFQPMLAPILHEVNVYVHYFFVPYRILWDPWEAFITGGSDGQNTTPLPQWASASRDIGSLWDYLGFPTGVTIPSVNQPMAFPKMAYAKIYNEYYRDETLQAEADLYQGNILNRNWEKDYFTSALPWQQRGIAPALPISGTTSAVWAFDQNIVYPDLSSGTAVTLNAFKNTTLGIYGVAGGDSKAVFDSGKVSKLALIIMLSIFHQLQHLMLPICALLFRFRNLWNGMLVLVFVTLNFFVLILACLLVMIACSVLSI